MQVPFAQVLGPFAQKKAPGEVDLLGGLAFWGDSLGGRFTRLLPRAGPSSYNLSVSLRSTAPLVGEPLAKPFTLRGLPRPLLQGEVASRQRWRRGCTKTEPFLCRKVRLAASFPVSFWRSLWYTCSAVHPRYLTGEGVKGLNHLLTILESVMANVISHYICKWLGKLDKNRKPD